MRKLGAPRRISDEKLQKVVDLMKTGIHQSEACRRVGIKVNTFTAMKSKKERIFLYEN